MASRKKASRAKGVKRGAKTTPRSQPRRKKPRRKKPTKREGDQKEGIVYSDVRREAAIRRLLR